MRYTAFQSEPEAIKRASEVADLICMFMWEKVISHLKPMFTVGDCGRAQWRNQNYWLCFHHLAIILRMCQWFSYNFRKIGRRSCVTID